MIPWSFVQRNEVELECSRLRMGKPYMSQESRLCIPIGLERIQGE